MITFVNNNNDNVVTLGMMIMNGESKKQNDNGLREKEILVDRRKIILVNTNVRNVVYRWSDIS